MQIQKEKIATEKLSTSALFFPIFTCIFLHEDGNKLNVNNVQVT